MKHLFVSLILLLPFQFALNVDENIDLVITRVLVPAVFLLWLARGMTAKKIWLPNYRETWLVCAFLFLSSLSLFLGRDWEEGVRKLVYLLSIFPVYFVGADLFRGKEFKEKTAMAIWASGFLTAIIGLIQFSLPVFIGLGPALKTWKYMAGFFLGSSFGRLVTTNPSWLVNISGETWMRAFGFFPDPHVFSFFVSLCMFSGLGYLVQRKTPRYRTLVIIGEIIMIVAVILSFSRGAYLGLIAGLLLFAIVFLKRAGALRKIIAAAGLIIIIISVFYSGPVVQRIASSFNLEEGSNAERLANWSQAADVIRDHPLAGVGLGNYSRVIDPSAGERSSIYAHNLYLDIAVETGILNSLIFVLLIIVSIWRNLKNGNAINLGLAAGLVGFSVHSVFDTALWSPQVLVVFLLIIALGLNNNSKISAKGGSASG